MNKDIRAKFEQNIYKYAKGFAKTHYIVGIDYDDYIQELVMSTCEHLNDYDENKSSLVTWCYLNFKGKYSAILYKLTKNKNYEIDFFNDDDEFGDKLRDVIIQSKDDINYYFFIKELLDNCSLITKEWLMGYTMEEIAKKNNRCKGSISLRIKKDIKKLKGLLGGTR